jgi:hypothetical protein
LVLLSLDHNQSGSSAPALSASASAAASAAAAAAASSSSAALDDGPAPLAKTLCLLEPEVSVDLGGLPLWPCSSPAFPCLLFLLAFGFWSVGALAAARLSLREGCGLRC